MKRSHKKGSIMLVNLAYIVCSLKTKYTIFMSSCGMENDVTCPSFYSLQLAKIFIGTVKI